MRPTENRDQSFLRALRTWCRRALFAGFEESQSKIWKKAGAFYELANNGGEIAGAPVNFENIIFPSPGGPGSNYSVDLRDSSSGQMCGLVIGRCALVGSWWFYIVAMLNTNECFEISLPPIEQNGPEAKRRILFRRNGECFGYLSNRTSDDLLLYKPWKERKTLRQWEIVDSNNSPVAAVHEVDLKQSNRSIEYVATDGERVPIAVYTQIGGGEKEGHHLFQFGVLTDELQRRYFFLTSVVIRFLMTGNPGID
jgi:hypothetical protein